MAKRRSRRRGAPPYLVHMGMRVLLLILGCPSRGRAPTLDQYAIQTATDMPQAWRMIRRFWQTALREDLRGQPFLTVLPDLESSFVSLAPAFAAAAALPNANAETIMSTVLREHVAIAQAAKLGQAAKLACKYANCQSGSG